MSQWTTFEFISYSVIAFLFAIALYFFVITRLSLALQTILGTRDKDTAHIYWVYKLPFFIWLTDRMFIVSTILLNQYSKLVATVCKRLNPSLKDKRILQMSCAFGNVSEKIAERCAEHGAEEFVVTDIMQSELDNAKRKLKRFGGLCTYQKEDATHLSFEDQSFDYVVMFFLPHEVPFDKKEIIMSEANRVLKPGGKIVVGEFHKPKSRLMQFFGKLYFFVFEPYALEMWGRFNFGQCISQFKEWRYEIKKETFFMDNFQVVAAKKLPPLA